MIMKRVNFNTLLCQLWDVAGHLALLDLLALLEDQLDDVGEAPEVGDDELVPEGAGDEHDVVQDQGLELGPVHDLLLSRGETLQLGQHLRETGVGSDRNTQLDESIFCS